MSGIIGFFVAVGIVSAILFMLMTRADRISERRQAYAESADRGGISSGTDSFWLLSWFSSNSSSSSSDDFCTSSSPSSFSGDTNCSDGGGGGDGGGSGGD